MRCYDSTTCLDILHRFNKRKLWKLSKCSAVSEIATMVWFSFVSCFSALGILWSCAWIRSCFVNLKKCIK